MDEALPSVGTTKEFLALCERYGSQRAAVGAVDQARKTGVSGLPRSDDWTAWSAGEMQAAIQYLESRRAGRERSSLASA